VREQNLFGLNFVDERSIGVVADTMLESPPAHESGWLVVVTPNVDHLIRYATSPADRRVAEHAAIVLPDGSPVIWASRLLGCPVHTRLTGTDLFATLWPRLVGNRQPVVVVAANNAVATALHAIHPGARCIVAPQFDADNRVAIVELAGRIQAEVAATGAQHVLLGVAMPKHHRLCAALTEFVAPAPAVWVLLLGAAAEFHIGTRRRAPKWMQRSGLEWLHRLACDPRRMARRYLVDDLAFFPLVWREWREIRRHRRARRAGVELVAPNSGS
jgi:exopolysaccharide biosynthesis WecB/TagA/CpsF family protein